LTSSEERFDGFVREASPGLLRAAWLLVGDWPAAEDLVQTAFEKTWPRWSRLLDDKQRLDYLHRVLTNAFLRGQRRKWVGEIATGDLPHRAAVDETDALLLRTSVLLDPCPAYAGRDDATARSGGFSDPISSGYLPCISRGAVIRPGHPLHWTIPATSLPQTPGTGAIPGSTVYVQLGIAGVPPLRLTTTAHR